MDEIRVGTLAMLKAPCLGNLAGICGVCYDVYDIGGEKGWSFIFANGNYDGFSAEDVALFLKTFAFCDELAGYQFTNVMKLCNDFSLGVFDEALM